jgi:uncharacterized protein (TIGR01777 family)
MTSILITGGTGLIGKHLCNVLRSKGYNILILSRNKTNNPNTYYWNISENYIDPKAIQTADYVIHLAGSGIADKRWTKKIKKELIDSRVKSANLLFSKIKTLNPNLKAFISASGIGYYGTITSEKIFKETDASGNDFLATVCKVWEEASNQFNSLNIRTVILRTGVVFSKKGGAFEKMSQPIKLGFGSPIGTGNQYIPWIHIDDLCNMYVEAIENNELNGIYNAVASDYVTNEFLTKSIATILDKKAWLPNVPSFILKLIFGEMAVILLEGSRVSAEKIKSTGFKFKYPFLLEALKDLNT